MHATPAAETSELQRCLDLCRKSHAWDQAAALAARLPAELAGPWLTIADEISFALGQLRRFDEAIALRRATYEREATHRRASALAYLFYAALMERDDRRGREADRRAFLQWVQRALDHRPDSVRDLYRLGVFEARIESQHDVRALRAFTAAVTAYRALPPASPARGYLRAPYVRSLYAAARSALALRRHADARAAIFACIREDEPKHHVAPLYKLHLAGKVCYATGELDAAERAFRLALDADGPRDRAFVLTALAELASRREHHADALAWLDRIPVHRRDAYAWRLLGDIQLRAGEPEAARIAWEHALRRDRAGRHLTLVRLGELHASAGRWRAAEQCFDRANTFRRRTYHSEHGAALRGLAAAYAATGRAGEAEALLVTVRALEARAA